MFERTKPDSLAETDIPDPLAPAPRSASGLAMDTTELGSGESLEDGGAGHLGGKFGHYVILDELGAGGMGSVFAAYDPRLDRKVAIKVIHRGRSADLEQRVRMEREAQAMARLSHPNVVTVYEVGETDGRLFVAMEFVKGQDLHAWLKTAPRGWRAVVAMFIQAGEGLLAAHRAGLVHRDFKPANVFIGADGRARVGDFGLARRGSEEDADSAEARARARVDADAALTRSFDDGLTRTGATMGTPAYMAPEQFQGRSTDARTDQFAFCVALWEALHGRRPFVGGSFTELMANVVAGRRAPPPAGTRTPAWLRRAIERGLAIDPGARYPSMEALLDALRADPTRRRWMLAGVAAIAVSVASGVGVDRYREAQAIAACESAGASIAEVWNDDARAGLREHLTATGVAGAAVAAEKTTPYLDAFAEAWRGARTEVCLRGHTGRWDPAVRERGELCLDARRMDLEALIDELSRGNAATIPYAVPAAAGLSPLDPCLDAPRLLRAPALPDDLQRVREIRRMIARAGASRVARMHEGGLTTIDEALTAARELGWQPLVAAARVLRGELLHGFARNAEAESELLDAFFLAEESGSFEEAADAATSLTQLIGLHQERFAEGLLWARHAATMLTILGEGDDGLRRARLLGHRGIVLNAAGAFDDARSTLSEALAISERVLGADHPDVAVALRNLSVVHAITGDHAGARKLLERSMAVIERTLGPDHPTLGSTLNNLALACEDAGQPREALAYLERQRGIFGRVLGTEHPEYAMTLQNMAENHLQLGDVATARTLHEQALATFEGALGPDDPWVGNALNYLARVEALQGEDAAAETHARRALAIFEASMGPNHHDLADPLVVLARVALLRGRPGDALPLAERAAGVQEGIDLAPKFIARTNLVLAEALWDAPMGAGQDRTRARQLAETSRDALRESATAGRVLTDIEAFLATHAGDP